MSTLSRRKFVITASFAAGLAAVPGISGVAPRPPAQRDLSDWDAVRDEFSLNREYVHASLFFLASHPRPVKEAIDELRRKIDADPFQTIEHAAFGPPEENLHLRTTSAIARYVGGSPDDIALTANTTTGLSLVYHGLPLRAGDEILTTTHDHYSHHESIRLATERNGARMRKVQLFEDHDASRVTREAIVARLREAISPATTVLAITWVHSSSGVKLPLTEISAMVAEVNAKRPPARAIRVVVDGVHGIGIEDPNIVATGIDVFAAGLHKWVLAPRGTGFVWARPSVWAGMRPTIPTFSAEEPYVAWMMGRAANGPATADWISPGGFVAYEYQWSIPAAIGFHEAIGPQRVTERLHSLNGAAIEALGKMPHVTLRTPASKELHAGLVAFDVEGMKPEEVVGRLLEKKIIASTSPYGKTYARLAFGLANSMSDVEKSVAAVGGLRGV
jgi:isopenicillin-N epimerase